MAKSKKKHINDDTGYLYVRLSRDDNLEGDSYSIINQKKLLTKVAKEKGYKNLEIFCDDGISGVTMDRPEFNKMIGKIKAGYGSAVFVKDLSRLGRNYIEVGKLTEEFFPEYGIRLVAVSDNLDTFEGENELTPIKNLFNEWYARDISKKRRISNKIKGSSGEPLGPPPYGYMKDPGNSKRWLIDDVAANVVKKIFGLFLDGFGIEQIAVKLTEEKILSPSEYAKTKNINRPNVKKEESPYYWGKSMVSIILSRQEYCGDIINFKTYTLSYKNKKRIENDPENMLFFKDANEAIIEREVFEQVQELRNKTRKKINNTGETNMFSGMLKCADCGANLHYHFNQKNHDIKYFNCPNFNKGSRKTCFTSHYIRVDFLEQIVLTEIRRISRFANQNEEEFTKAVRNYNSISKSKQIKLYNDELKTLVARDKEIDRLFEKIYEDNVSGKISDERFMKMSSNYETEQSEVEASIKELRDKCKKVKDEVLMTDSFLNAVKKYTRVRKLTPRMLHELIDYIEIYHTQKIDGVASQRIVIHYNCVGVIDIPENIIAESNISLQTRKGVTLNYMPSTSIA